MLHFRFSSFQDLQGNATQNSRVKKYPKILLCRMNRIVQFGFFWAVVSVALVHANVAGIKECGDWKKFFMYTPWNAYKTQENWAKTCDTCKSVADKSMNDRQSPIDISKEKTNLRTMPLPKMSFKGPEMKTQGTYKNNKNTIQFDPLATAPKSTMCGGPLKGEYTFAQMHCHWGKTYKAVTKVVKKGSEHWLGGKQ